MSYYNKVMILLWVITIVFIILLFKTREQVQKLDVNGNPTLSGYKYNIVILVFLLMFGGGTLAFTLTYLYNKYNSGYIM